MSSPAALLTKATVVGAGAMGTVVAQLLATNQVHVALLGRDPLRVQELLVRGENRRYLPGVRLGQRVVPTASPEGALASTELIISAVPCQHLRETWSRLRTLVPPGVPICSVTKGIETRTLARPSQILAELCPANPIAVLSGPNIAYEVARCLPATAVAASAQPELADLIQGVLSTSWFRVYTNSDVVGVELAGALKNVIALAAGLLDGLRAGDNAKAALLTRGLVEITRLGVAMGARASTFSGLAGMGDLITTCVSPLGRNRRAGERIGSGASVEQVLMQSTSVIEGIPTTQAALRLAQQYEVEMPITRAVYEILFEGKSPLEAITELMHRPPKAEETSGSRP